MLAVIDAIDSDGGNFRDSILGLQNELLGMDQVDCPVTHHFAPSVYAREIFMPAGAVVVGKIHKHAHLNIISKGRVIVSTEFGKKQLVAPCTFVSEAGTKRAVYIVEDCIWTTIHPTEETDLEKIEEHVIAKDYDALLDFQREKLEDMKGDNL